MKLIREEFEVNDGVNFPGKTYVDELLKPVFNDQKMYLFDTMFKIHEAHTTMLTEQGILTQVECQMILDGLHEVKLLDQDELHYSPQYEDLFFLVESRIGERIGEELAGKNAYSKK